MFSKKKGLGARLKALFGIGKGTEEFFEELEDILIEGDLGARVALEVVEELRDEIKKERLKTREDFMEKLKAILSGYINIKPLPLVEGRMNFFLVLGVNGVGKTTTIAKMAHHYKEMLGADRIMLSAGDTFRAAAINQLKVHGERLGIKVIHQTPGSDPGAVIFDTIVSAKAKEVSLILADTAGRLHNKANLVKELAKINKIAENKLEGGNYRKILVIDATTGQNAIQQVEIFHEAVGIDSLILAKYDSTARGGMVIPICKKTGLSFSFMGIGEKLKDLVPFDLNQYFSTLFGDTGE